jgi:hypothetical protein
VLKFVARFDHNSTELTLLKAQTTGARPSARGCYHEIVTFLPRAAASAGA